MISQEGETKAELMQKIHEKVKANLEHQNELNKKQADKGRKEVSFEPGDWVWLHMRSERFPNQRKSKLSPRGDGPFKVLKKINDNAYQLELPGELNVSSTFNVSDLSYFHADETVLRSEPSQEGENDEDIEPDINIPTLRQAPRTRSGTKGVIASFCEAIEGLFAKANSNPNLDDITNRLDKLSISGSEVMKTQPYVIQDGPKDNAILWSIIPHKEMVSLFTISPLK